MQDVHNEILSLENISKCFSTQDVLTNLSLSVRKGDFVTLLGPSGCGKTTTIRIIAGLEHPDLGSIILGGKDVTNLPPDKRNVNTVFQSYALFPHLSVYNNIAYGLKLRSLSKDEIRRRVEEMLDIVELPGYGNRKPSELSGGQRQRVAIARALVLNPDILLLDEPLGALDLQLRRQMQRELKEIQTRLNITFIYITHDQEEALNMSDRIVIMNDGRIEQQGTPSEIYEKPATRFAASFIGESNLIKGVITESDGDVSVLQISGHTALCMTPTASIPPGECTLSVRPDDIRLSKESVEGFSLHGTIKEQQYTGSLLRTVVTLDGGEKIISNRYGRLRGQFSVGERVFVSWNPQHGAVIGGYVSDDSSIGGVLP